MLSQSYQGWHAIMQACYHACILGKLYIVAYVLVIQVCTKALAFILRKLICSLNSLLEGSLNSLIKKMYQVLVHVYDSCKTWLFFFLDNFVFNRFQWFH